jgi:nitroreductase
MQLGTRWSVRATPPARLPEPLLARIAEVEAGLPDDTTLRWTLTWLEGRAIVELDDGTTLEG